MRQVDPARPDRWTRRSQQRAGLDRRPAISTLPEPDRARLRRHEIGLVFQSDNLLPFLTAAENVSLRLALDDPAAGNERSLELLAGLGLEGEANRYPTSSPEGSVSAWRWLERCPPAEPDHRR